MIIQDFRKQSYELDVFYFRNEGILEKWTVLLKENKCSIGEIFFYEKSDQYIFSPLCSAGFRDCNLREIAEILHYLNAEYFKQKSNDII